MKKALVSLILGIGLFSGCIQEEYTKRKILDDIEKDRIFSAQKYEKYSAFMVKDYELGIIDGYYDFNKDDKPDVRAMFEFEMEDRAVFIGIYQDNGTNFYKFYSDSDRNGILEEEISRKGTPQMEHESDDNKESELLPQAKVF